VLNVALFGVLLFDVLAILGVDQVRSFSLLRPLRVLACFGLVRGSLRFFATRFSVSFPPRSSAAAAVLRFVTVVSLC
jgi:hypothetical protein